MIKFSFTSRFSDYWRLNRHVLLKSTRKLLWISAALIVVYMVSPWALQRMTHQADIWAAYRQNWGVLILPAIMAVMFGLTYLGARTRWKKAEELRVEKSFEITDEGVQVRGEGVNGFLAWQHFANAEFKSGWFYLKTKQNSFHYFPSSSVSDVALLKDLLKERVEKTNGMN